MRRFVGISVVVSVWLALSASSALGKDYADVARNIVPSGQYGSLTPPANAAEQAEMYDALTPLFDQVGNGDLDNKFKSAKFGVGPDGPGTIEQIPRPGVTVIRDRFHVPHINAETAADGIFTAGYLLAEDRGLLLAQARWASRVAAVDVPNLTALGVITSLGNFVPSEQTENEIAKQTKVLKKTNEGHKVLRDIDTYINGINAYLAAKSPNTEPWTRNDVYAVNALKGQFLGEGGGDEARRTQFLAGLQDANGNGMAMDIFNDLRQFRNQETPSTIDEKFPYGGDPEEAKGNVIIDHDSYDTFSPTPSRALAERANVDGGEASNTLQINKEQSDKGIPLMVGGPRSATSTRASPTRWRCTPGA